MGADVQNVDVVAVDAVVKCRWMIVIVITQNYLVIGKK